MTYQEALEFIHTANIRGRKRPLAMTAELLLRVGSPERHLRFVHVAGTNGKGSVSAYIESVLRRSGLVTGLFTSPYIARFNERIRVNGQDIPDRDLADTLSELLPALEGPQPQPSEFELVTVLGLMYFAKRGCDVVVLEVGLGGALDATNVIPESEVSVITALGLDHTAYLGGTMREIARAKAGIIKPGGRAVIYSDVEGVIAQTARERGAELHVMDFSKLRVRTRDLTGTDFDYGGIAGLRTPLAGAYQPFNAALAAEALLTLRRERGFNITDDHIREGIPGTRWPGRFELLRRSPDFILDGGHNPQAVAATVETLRGFYPGRRFVFLTGVMADKDAESIADIISGDAQCVITISPPTERGMDPGAYAKLYSRRGTAVRAAGTVHEGVVRALEAAGDGGVVCALGSIYLVEPIRRELMGLSEQLDG